MNTRRYPRTTNEAFQRTAEYGCAIERPLTTGDKAVTVACIFAALYLAVFFISEWLK